jgi:hypothetical protein
MGEQRRGSGIAVLAAAAIWWRPAGPPRLPGGTIVDRYLPHRGSGDPR